MKLFTRVTSIFLSIIAVLHILRILTGIDVVIGSWHMPFWCNGLGALVTGGFALMLWKENL